MRDCAVRFGERRECCWRALRVPESRRHQRGGRPVARRVEVAAHDARCGIAAAVDPRQQLLHLIEPQRIVASRPVKVCHVDIDGLALDEDGSLAVAHIGMGVVWLFDRFGQPVYRIQSCAGLLTTNVAYGGPGRKTLYITESDSGSILKAELPTAGRAMFSDRP